MMMESQYKKPMEKIFVNFLGISWRFGIPAFTDICMILTIT